MISIRSIGSASLGDTQIAGMLDHQGDLVGFFGAGPTVQQDAIASPSGGSTVDLEGRAAIQEILDLLEAYGLSQ
jgi:hypothetical protein